MSYYTWVDDRVASNIGLDREKLNQLIASKEDKTPFALACIFVETEQERAHANTLMYARSFQRARHGCIKNQFWSTLELIRMACRYTEAFGLFEPNVSSEYGLDWCDEYIRSTEQVIDIPPSPQLEDIEDEDEEEDCVIDLDPEDSSAFDFLQSSSSPTASMDSVFVQSG